VEFLRSSASARVGLVGVELRVVDSVVLVKAALVQELLGAPLNEAGELVPLSHIFMHLHVLP
jgi:hypothetical protein